MMILSFTFFSYIYLQGIDFIPFKFLKLLSPHPNFVVIANELSWLCNYFE